MTPSRFTIPPAPDLVVVVRQGERIVEKLTLAGVRSPNGAGVRFVVRDDVFVGVGATLELTLVVPDPDGSLAAELDS